MNFPTIQIQTKPALIGIEQTKGHQSIEQPKADLSIEQPKADLSISQKNARLNIDQSQAWHDMELYGPLEATDRAANRGRQQLLEGIARRAQEGNQLMQIENGGNAIQSISKANSNRPMAPINVTWIPSRFAVKIQFEPNQLDIQAQANKPLIQSETRQPIINYQRGGVNIFMQQYNDIQIDVKV
ncbi:DUF6470 family protein [Bacillaceae bacterium W0354]